MIGADTQDRSSKRRPFRQHAPRKARTKPSALPGSILNRVNDGIVAFDANFNYIYVNPYGAELLGRKPDELIGKNYWEEYPEARGTPFANAYLRAIETQEPVFFEDYYVHWDRWFTNRIFPSQGGITIYFSDITERKRGEEARRRGEENLNQLNRELHAAKARLEALIDVAPLAIMMLDLEDRVELWNPAAEKMFGWQAAEILGLRNPLVGPDQQADYSVLVARLLDGEPIINRETVRRHKDGSLMQVSVSSAPILDAGGRPVGRMAILANIAQQLQAQESVRQRNIELAVLNQIGQDLSRLRQPAEILERVYAEIGRVLDNRNLYIALYDPETHWITFPVYFVEGQRVTGRQRLLGDGITDHILRANEPFLAERNLPAVLHEQGLHMLGTVSRSYIGVPIRSGGQAIGVIALQDYLQDDIYNEHHLELLTTIATQAGIALENARLFSAVQQELEERKRTETALRESQMLFAAAFQDAPVLVSISDLSDGTYVDVNEEALRVSGYSREEVIGRRSYDTGWISFADRNRILRELYTHGRIADMEMEFHKKDGTQLVGLFNGDIITVNGRKCLLTVTIDITERKQAERALQHTQEQVHAVVQTASDAIATLDTNYHIALWNAAAEKIYGYTAAEMIGQTTDRVVPERLRASNYRLIERLFARGETRRTGKILETTGLHKDGHEIPIEISYAVWKTAAGMFITSIVRDISERKQRENELSAIATLSAALRTVTSRKQMLPVMIQQVVSLLNCAAVTIEIVDPQTQETRIEAGYGLWEGLVGMAQPTGLGMNAIISSTLCPFRTQNLKQESSPTYPEWARRDIHGTIGVPLIAQEKLIGYIWVGWKTDHIAASEERLLAALADIAANAIHRTTLHEQTRKDAAELAQAYDSTLEGWARALELRDQDTEGHTRRVLDLTVELARRMGVPPTELENIRRGAMLHDIGKMGVPDAILNKAGSLDEREWEVMRMHPTYAIQMLHEIEYLRPALNIPLYHHEKWDGSGYPSGLRGDEIPLEARIFAIVDVWDALTNKRIYRPAWPPEKARSYIREQSGLQFDPAVVAAFLKLQETSGPA